MDNKKAIILELSVDKDKYIFPSSISEALVEASDELSDLDVQLNETLETIKNLTPNCDKYDYILSASSGALCGILDVFLVGKPGESSLGDMTDEWFANRTIDFAQFCGYQGENDSLSSAVSYLEQKFKIPYDQSVGGGVFRELINLTPSNHHFKSLGHNPTLLGLFFSILNQFTNTSDFISDGELISLNNSDGKFELKGNNIPGKLFCGIANWIGHLISDVSGSSSSKGRGMGIPSPIWSWSNDVIAIKRKLNVPASEFDKSVNDLALKLFEKGYDSRFQTKLQAKFFIFSDFFAFFSLSAPKRTANEKMMPRTLVKTGENRYNVCGKILTRREKAYEYRSKRKGKGYCGKISDGGALSRCGFRDGDADHHGRQPPGAAVRRLFRLL